MKKYFDCKQPLPTDFDGVPILNNQRSWFVPYQADRRTTDVPTLWRVFEEALKENPFDSVEFMDAYNMALEVKGVNVNLSMGLFWIRPFTFLNVDGTNRSFLNISSRAHLTAASYKETLAQIQATHEKPLVELSYAAYQGKQECPEPATAEAGSSGDSYWFVGASWGDVDKTAHFLSEGIWVNGYQDGRYADLVNAMQVGERIAIKAVATQKHNLPFDSRGKTVSKMNIKARGTVVKNLGDGRTVEVEWETDFSTKEWYFFTYQRAVWKLQVRDNYRHREHAEQLIRFAFYDHPQDYNWFCSKWFDELGSTIEEESAEYVNDIRPYGIEDIVADGVFVEVPEIEQILSRLADKKNLILQGAPGVGKTFIAEKLAFALMQETDRSRIKFVQFHQSYSYEDFVRGYRPLEENAGTFGIKDGQFPLMYPRAGEPDFFVPENLYIIGMMNFADRSLALVDYALRRRFAFKTLVPEYKNEAFSNWLVNRSMPKHLVNQIVDRMTELNQSIEIDESLGENYCVGHSYFCPNESDLSGKDRNWYDGIIKTEIIPLLEEYWFDDRGKQKSARKKLLRV